jgi:hypothetical protein
LDIWVGEAHDTPQGNYLVMNLNSEIKFQNFITESATFVFTSDEGSATIGVVVFVTESLGFIVQLQGIKQQPWYRNPATHQQL